MSQHLKKAASLLNIIRKSNHTDCVNFVENLNDRGIELICKLIYFIVSGDLTLDSFSHVRLKKKLKKHVREIKQLFLTPKKSQDVKKKKKILQQKKIVGILTAIASAATPIINRITSEQE